MRVKKIQKGIYDAFDKLNNHYRIADTLEASLDKPEGSEKWGVWEQEEGQWIFIDSNHTMTECLEFLETIEAAHRLGR